MRFRDGKVLTRLRSREPGKPVASHRLGEALIDIQTIIIVGLLYWLLREEQDNAFLRTWLFNNFPLGLYLLSLTVVAISGTLLVLTVARIVLFVTGSNRTLVEEVLQKLKRLKEQLLELNSTERSSYSAMMLTSFGTVLALWSYFILRIIPLVALGISCIILGFTALSLPRQIGGGRGMRAMLEGATLSVEALLEASTVGRATYLPPSDGGIIFAYIPLSLQPENLSLNEMRQAPRSLVGRIPEFQDGFSLEEGLRYVLVESADICSRVMVEQTGNLIVVGMKGADMDIQGRKYQKSLGSLPSSLAACVVATFYHKPVTLMDERKNSDKLIARFRLLE